VQHFCFEKCNCKTTNKLRWPWSTTKLRHVQFYTT